MAALYSERTDARSVLVVASAALGLAACSLFYDPGDFSTKATTSDEIQGPDPCTRAGLAPKPNVEDGPDEPLKVYAARDLAMVVADRNTVGYDLDGVCTCNGAGPPDKPGAVRRGASSCAPRRQGDRLCDAEGGRDNAGAAILQNRLPDKPGASFDTGYRSAAENGLAGLLFAISEYDGRLDDPQVRVESFYSPGLDPLKGCAGTVPNAGENTLGGPRPAWDGCDAWRVGESFQQGGVGRAGTRDAWVTKGKLYARFPALRIAVSRTYVTFVDARVEAELLRPDLGARAPARLTKGIIAGSVRAEELLLAFGELRTGANGGPLCTTPAFAGLVEDTCANLDMALRTPEPGEAAPCDAASLVLTFEATGALRGSVAKEEPSASACAAAGIVPSCR
jgi:hypothetical protein